MNRSLNVFSASALALMSVLICGCGGGGGGGGGTGGGPSTSITLDRTTVTLTTDAPSQNVVATFRGDGVVVGTLPGTTAPSWLAVSAPQTGTSPVSVSITAFATMPPGRYATTLRFATGKADGSQVVFQDVNVTFTVDHVLSPAAMRPAYTAGASGFSSAPGFSSALTLVTDGATWQASSNQPWLTVTPTSGTGGTTLTATVSNTLAPGQYTGTITVRDTLTNRTRTTLVDLAVNPRLLAVRPRGVAMTSNASYSVMTRTVQVIDTAGLGGHWTASDDAPWLQVAAAPDAHSLTLTADDTGLADGIYYATVTVAPDQEPGLTNTTAVKVGLYVDHTSTAAPAAIVTGNILGANAIAADPIRPYAYVVQTIFDEPSSTFNGGLSVYNFHTGQLVDKLDFPGRIMTGVKVSPDGGLLIVSDTANSADTSDRFLTPIELNGSTRTLRPRWGGIHLGIQYGFFTIAEIGGAAVVLTGEKQIVSVPNGTVLGEFETDAVGGFLFTGRIAVSVDGGSAFLQGVSGANHRLARYRLTHLNNTFRVLETHNMNETGDGIDVASNPAGTQFITLSDGVNTPLRAYDSTTVTLGNSGTSTLPVDDTLDVAPNGDIYVTGRRNGFAQYDPNFVLRGSRTFSSSVQAAYGRVSSDGKRTVVVTAGTSGVADVHLNFFDSQLPL
jgi:hypothetical protein